MKWIRATDLENWSGKLASRVELVEMTAQLIKATVPNIEQMRFPVGDKGQVPGYDGYLRVNYTGRFVPDGESLWEFGVSAGSSKIKEDYRKRSIGSYQNKDQATLVLVSPHTWDNPREPLHDWLDKVNKSKVWKEVRCIDGPQLEDWLDDCPAVSAAFARRMGLAPREGVVSIDEFWDNYTGQFETRLNENVLIAGRKDQVDQLISDLGQQVGGKYYLADTEEDVVAFAVAAIRQLPDDQRNLLSSKTIVVDSKNAVQWLRNKPNHIFLLYKDAALEGGALKDTGLALFAKSADHYAQPATRLSRPSSSELGEAFRSMGIEDGYDLARECGCSLTVLRRRRPGANAPNPAWLDNATTLMPGFLAGGWDATATDDLAVLSTLLNGDQYSEFDKLLRKQSHTKDAPFDLIANKYWLARSQPDAFASSWHLIAPSQFGLLKSACIQVFSSTPIPPKPDDLWETKPKTRHSNWLRDGLATTLLLIAAYGGKLGLHIDGRVPQAFVDGIVEDLPGLHSDPRVIASLSKQMPLLFEAAPRPLLYALKQLLEGSQSAVATAFFDEENDTFGPRSTHHDLLWSLETCAWDPELIDLASELLFRLAMIDPGGRTTNRPINSLREIFIAWSPNTYATVDARTLALKHILALDNEIAWKLLMLLVPKNSDSSSPTSAPRFKSFGSSGKRPLTFGEVWKAQDETIALAIQLASGDLNRLLELVSKLAAFNEGAKGLTLTAIESGLQQADSPQKMALWEALRAETNRNKKYAHTDWSIKGSMLDRMQSIVDVYAPVDLVKASKWLFDDWSPDLPIKDVDQEAELASLRDAAVAKLFETYGSEGIIQLAEIVKFPQFVAESLVRTVIDRLTLLELIVDAYNGSNNLRTLAGAISQFSAQRNYVEWCAAFLSKQEKANWSPETTGYLMLGWPDNKKTWDVVESLGPKVEQFYWEHKQSFSRQDRDLQTTEFIIARYLKHNRPISAVQAMHYVLDEISPDLVFTVLENSIPQINESTAEFSNFAAHYFEEAFDTLAHRQDVDLTRLAELEYRYLPLFRHRDSSLAIHRLLTTDPKFFVDILQQVYKPATEKSSDTIVEYDARVVQAGYQILNSLVILPGDADAQYNVGTISSWITEIRDLAKNADRLLFADLTIGRAIAHSRHDETNDCWPQVEISEVIEKMETDDIERGIHTERINMRGAYYKAIGEGGKKERVLAEEYRSWARVRAKFRRTSALLKRIADNWDDYARDADQRAEIDKRRF